ncbi:glutaredoxin family protein [Labilithrix luteola]|uniref:glutaredoxin family protein n=1 Tax=Labilithrix luteola TaxID=1391654 RepID=UPI001F0B4BAF|nr:glutaredoxin domain-containing protein [Labilithrix luteola]
MVSRIGRALGLALVVVAFVVGVVGVTACRKSPEGVAVDETPPTVTETSAGLLLTWVDDKGEFHVEQKVESVPATAREMVRVVDPSREEPSGGRLFLVDLRNSGADGHYPVRVASREEFEKLAVSRRAAHGGVLSPQAAPTGSAAEAARSPVVIYGASWCGPCHQAQAFFKRKGVAFVEKDIEQDSGAAREMRAKLSKVGMRGGSIPVIDVRGKILVGFDEGAIERALAVVN